MTSISVRHGGSAPSAELNPNNFDLIRLCAASQVMLTHATFYFHSQTLSTLASLLALIPGVPAFFFVSGFLISAEKPALNRKARSIYVHQSRATNCEAVEAPQS